MPLAFNTTGLSTDIQYTSIIDFKSIDIPSINILLDSSGSSLDSAGATMSAKAITAISLRFQFLFPIWGLFLFLGPHPPYSKKAVVVFLSYISFFFKYSKVLFKNSNLTFSVFDAYSVVWEFCSSPFWHIVCPGVESMNKPLKFLLNIIWLFLLLLHKSAQLWTCPGI